MSYKLFRCVFSKKSGYEKCSESLKVVFPYENQSVHLYTSINLEKDHNHTPIAHHGFGTHGEYLWKHNPRALEIVKQGVLHNDNQTQIKMALEVANIDPLPSTTVLNNKISYERKKCVRMTLTTNLYKIRWNLELL